MRFLYTYICIFVILLYIDVDECVTNPCDAEYGICINTNGSFACACDTGYTLRNDTSNECDPGKRLFNRYISPGTTLSFNGFSS